MTLGKGRAAAVTDADMAALADSFGCHPADLEAIAEVESSGFGWFDDGRIKILFEKHWMYKHVSGAERTKAINQGLARKSWVSPKNGGYADQKSPNDRYRLLSLAIAINREAALKSISAGRFQIMGFNHGICGFASALEMWDAFLDSEANQLRAFGNFLKSKGLVAALRRRDFGAVEKGYNGGGLGGAYAKKMKAASDRLRADKWKNYRLGSMKPEPAVMPAPEPAQAAPAPAPVPEAIQPVSRPVAQPAPVTEAPEPNPIFSAILAFIARLFANGRPNWTPDDDKT